MPMRVSLTEEAVRLSEESSQPASYLGQWATAKVLSSLGIKYTWHIDLVGAGAQDFTIKGYKVEVKTVNQNVYRNLFIVDSLIKLRQPDIYIVCRLSERDVDVVGFATVDMVLRSPLKLFYDKTSRCVNIKELTEIKMLRIFLE